MSYRQTEHLRVLIANKRTDRLALVAPMVDLTRFGGHGWVGLCSLVLDHDR